LDTSNQNNSDASENIDFGGNVVPFARATDTQFEPYFDSSERALLRVILDHWPEILTAVRHMQQIRQACPTARRVLADE
jgi:hypothetical protein